VAGLGADSFRERLAAAFERRDVDATIELLEASAIEARARAAMAEADAGPLEAIVVGGGDGSIRTVAAVLAGTDVALGVLPLGTLNHFAKDLGIPLDIDGAVEVIASAAGRRVDVGDVNGELFLNNSSVGIYPYMVLDRDRRQSTEGRGKWIAMALALVRALKRFPRRRLVVAAEGTVRAYRTPILFVGNNEYDINFLSLGRRGQLDQGTLHLYVARPRNAVALFWLAVRAAFGMAHRAEALDSLTAASADIRSRASRLTVALDGEVRTLPTPLRYRSQPGALIVLAPEPVEN